MGIFFGGVLKFQIFFWVFEIPDIFWGRRVDAGPGTTYEEKMRVPPPPPHTHTHPGTWKYSAHHCCWILCAD